MRAHPNGAARPKVANSLFPRAAVSEPRPSAIRLADVAIHQDEARGNAGFGVRRDPDLEGAGLDNRSPVRAGESQVGRVQVEVDDDPAPGRDRHLAEVLQFTDGPDAARRHVADVELDDLL